MASASPTVPSAEIFRAYDIRGVVGDTLTSDAVYWIGRAFAAEALAAGEQRVAIGGDGRDSTPALRTALLRGLRAGGLTCTDIGCAPTPLLYYATHVLGTGTGVMITGSHNPPEYNGLKMMIGGGTLSEDRIQDLRKRIERRDFATGAGISANTDVPDRTVDLTDRYVDEVTRDVTLARALKVVVDCGNGVAGLVAPRLLADLGCAVTPLYAEVDGTFPNHHPDPADPANLVDLIAAVKREAADIGLAFDGDGDRLGVVTGKGEVIWPDRTMMLFATDVLARNPGATIVFDVKCSRHLPVLVRECGGEPIMWRTGHSHIKAKIQASGALLGGEFSGHLCFADRWYGFDDASYAAARLVEILAATERSADDVFAELPTAVATPEIKIATDEEAKFDIMRRLGESPAFDGGTVNTIDGIRVDYPEGWGLVRPSNTSPMLTLRFEADKASDLDRIQDLFNGALGAIDKRLSFR